jgi:hypothetical protein
MGIARVLVDFKLAVVEVDRQIAEFTCNSPPNFLALRYMIV